jgi:hypothetical protein
MVLVSKSVHPATSMPEFVVLKSSTHSSLAPEFDPAAVETLPIHAISLMITSPALAASAATGLAIRTSAANIAKRYRFIGYLLRVRTVVS